MTAGSSHPLLNYGLQKLRRKTKLFTQTQRPHRRRLPSARGDKRTPASRRARGTKLGRKRYSRRAAPGGLVAHLRLHASLLMAVAERTARQPQPGAPEYLQSTPPGPVPAVSCGVLRRKPGRGLRRPRDSRGTSQRMPPRCGRSRLPPRPGRRLTTRHWCARPASCPRPPGFPPAARGRCGCSTRTPSSRSGRPGRTTTACSARPRTP